jgi:hypothetical protein
MTHPIYPCLWIDEKTKETAEFYCSVLSFSVITIENLILVNLE